MSDVEQSVPSKIEECVVDPVWPQRVVRHGRWYVQDVGEPEKMLP